MTLARFLVIVLAIGLIACESSPSTMGGTDGGDQPATASGGDTGNGGDADSGDTPAPTKTAEKPGFAVRTVDGKAWIFYADSKELKTVDGGGELAKHVTTIANVNGEVQTVKAPDTEVIKAYKASKPGFIARYVKGYLWVFKVGAKEFDIVESGGELAKHVTKIKNIDGNVMSIKAPDSATIDGYVAAQ